MALCELSMKGFLLQPLFEDGMLHFWELVEATPLRRSKAHEAAWMTSLSTLHSLPSKFIIRRVTAGQGSTPQTATKALLQGCCIVPVLP